jgi:hypothetical protein
MSQELFNYLHDTFDVIALQSEMQGIERIVRKQIIDSVIEELEKEKFPKQLMGSIMAQRWTAAIVRAIEILKSRI